MFRFLKFFIIFFLVAATTPRYQKVKLTIKYDGKVYKDFLCAVVELQGNTARIISEKIPKGKSSIVVLVSKDTLEAAKHSVKINEALFKKYNEEILEEKKRELAFKKLQFLDKKRGILPAAKGLFSRHEKEMLIFQTKEIRIGRGYGKELSIKELEVNGKKIDLDSIKDHLKFYEYAMTIMPNTTVLPNKIGDYHFNVVAEFEGKLYRVKPFTIKIKIPESEKGAYAAFDEYEVRTALEYQGYKDSKKYEDLPFAKLNLFVEKFPRSEYADMVKQLIWGVFYQYLALDNSEMDHITKITVDFFGKERVKNSLESCMKSYKELPSAIKDQNIINKSKNKSENSQRILKTFDSTYQD